MHAFHYTKAARFALAPLFLFLLAGLSVVGSATTSDPVIAAAGDIACDPSQSGFNSGNGTTSCSQGVTSNVILNMNPAAVLPLGDNQYECGGYNAFLQSYNLSWGRFLSITHPVVGNHEYLTSGGTGCDTTGNASGYFQYYGALAGPSGKGYYSYDVGTWHLIALNSNCGNVGGCGSGSPQASFLQSDLAAHLNQCILAYWHIPLWSSGGRASTATLPLVQQLYNAGADVILSGHDHDYERFAQQNPSGGLDTVKGIREFVVGTGGSNHTPFVTTAPNSQVGNATTFGALKLTLHPSSYDWVFVPDTAGGFTDSGTTTCHHGSVTTPTLTNTATATKTPKPTRTSTATPTLKPSATPTLPKGGASHFIYLPFVVR